MHHEGHQVTSGRRKEEPFMADDKACVIDFFTPVNLSNTKSIQSNRLPFSYVKLDDIVVDAMYKGTNMTRVREVASDSQALRGGREGDYSASLQRFTSGGTVIASPT
jgi:hypothetical protein